MSLSPIQKQLVSFVRQMPDEQILDLVREQLGAVHASPTTTRRVSTSKRDAPRKPRRRMEGRAASGDLAARVLGFVLSSDGVALKDVAEGLSVPKAKAGTVLRGLRDAGKVVQAGDRRFARYGATKKVAEAASLRARGK